MRSKAFPYMLIVFVGSLIYSNSFSIPFSLDDFLVIVGNPLIRDFGPWGEIFRFDPTRFITHLSFAFNSLKSGLNTQGFHQVNLALHILNAVFCYVLIQRTLILVFFKGKDADKSSASHTHTSFSRSSFQFLRYIPLCCALIFLTHPIQTQAVSYIVQRSVLLAAFCYFIALILFIEMRLNFQPIYYWLTWIIVILGTMTKPIFITLPLMILLYEFTFFSGSWKHIKGKFFIYLPYIVPVVFIPVFLTLYVLDSSFESFDMSKLSYATRLTSDISRLTYLLTEFRVLVTYMRLLILPINQNFDYDYPLSGGISEASTILSILAMLGVLGFAVFMCKRKPLIFFSLFWIFIVLSLESTIFPLPDVIFEHRLYMAVVGFALFVCVGLAYLIKNRKLYVFIFSLLILSYCLLTYSRNLIWQDQIGFLQDVIKKSPNKARLHQHLGWIYRVNGLYAQAESEYKKALVLDKKFYLAYLTLGELYLIEEKTDEAVETFKSALAQDSTWLYPRFKLGEIYFKMGQYKLAQTQFEEILKVEPQAAIVCLRLSDVYAKLGNSEGAKTYLEKAKGLGHNSPGKVQTKKSGKK